MKEHRTAEVDLGNVLREHNNAFTFITHSLKQFCESVVEAAKINSGTKEMLDSVKDVRTKEEVDALQAKLEEAKPTLSFEDINTLLQRLLILGAVADMMTETHPMMQWLNGPPKIGHEKAALAFADVNAEVTQQITSTTDKIYEEFICPTHARVQAPIASDGVIALITGVSSNNELSN